MKELIKTFKNEQDEILASGRELHEFLEVKTDYKDWFPRMVKYGFSENEDFSSFLSESTGGRPSVDHAMKLDMAKEISMLQRTDKGKQARLYFIEVEKQHKQQLDTSNLSPELQFMNSVVNQLAKQEMTAQRIENKVDNITEIVALNTTDWRKEARHLINKMAKAQGGYGAYGEIQSDIYQELERRANCRLSIRLTNMQKTAARNGASMTKQNKLNKLDVIADEKRLLEIYLAVVKEFAIKYGVWKDR